MAGHCGFYFCSPVMALVVENEYDQSRTLVISLSGIRICTGGNHPGRSYRHLHNCRNRVGDDRLVFSGTKDAGSKITLEKILAIKSKKRSGTSLN